MTTDLDQTGSPFYKYWLPSVITLLSVAVTGFVGYAGYRISRAQVEISDKTRDQQWKVDAGKFVIEHQDVILKGTKEQKEQFGRIAAIAFPPEIAKDILEQIRETSPDPKTRQEWGEIQQKVVPKKIKPEAPNRDQQPNPTVPQSTPATPAQATSAQQPGGRGRLLVTVGGGPVEQDIDKPATARVMTFRVVDGNVCDYEMKLTGPFYFLYGDGQHVQRSADQLTTHNGLLFRPTKLGPVSGTLTITSTNCDVDTSKYELAGVGTKSQ